MNSRTGLTAFAVLLMLGLSSARAANSVSASASSLCGYINVSGSVTLDSGYSISGDVRITVFQNGCLAKSYTQTPLMNSFSWGSTSTYASGTYTIEVQVDIVDSCCTTTTYAYTTTVTVP